MKRNEVLTKRNMNDDFNWNINHPPISDLKARYMRKSGYHEAVLSDENYHRSWTDVHDWCFKNLDKRYTWCSDSFFFCNESDKMQFVLRWS